MAGDILINYGTVITFSVTNLHSLPSSQTHVGGWSSAGQDNGPNEYEDVLISGTFTANASNIDVGNLFVYAYGNLGDTAFSSGVPDIFSTGTEGTEGVADIPDTFRRNSAMRFLHVVNASNVASAVYVMPPTSLALAFGGWVPDWWALWVTNDLTTGSTAGLHTGGNALYGLPVHRRYT